MPFLRNVPGLETIHRDFAPKGVQVIIIYKSIVHPGTNGFVDAFTVEERLQQVAIAKQRLGTTIPIVSDSLDGAIVKALHSAPNAEFVVDKDGTVLQRKFWHDPKALRTLLESKVGKVEKPTRVEDLGMKLAFPKSKAPRGKVKPLKMPGERMILKVTPEMPSENPFFAKLLAEGDPGLLGKCTGKLYLGFYLDPVYQVHWNNPAGGLSWSIDYAGKDDDIEFEPVTGKTPTYEHEADVDPREFLIDFAAPADARDFRVSVRYMICDDNGKFCMPVEQHYHLELAAIPTKASRAGDWMTRLVGDPLQYDADGNGVVTRDELPKGRAQIILLHLDMNHDDVIDAKEAALFHDMIRIKPGETGR